MSKKTRKDRKRARVQRATGAKPIEKKAQSSGDIIKGQEYSQARIRALNYLVHW